MRKSSYYIDNGTFFGITYVCDSVALIGKYLWDDTVGDAFTTAANKSIKAFNAEQENVWDKIGELTEVKEDEIQYTTQENEIKGLYIC